jgi:hypothetical protein
MRIAACENPLLQDSGWPAAAESTGGPAANLGRLSPKHGSADGRS